MKIKELENLLSISRSNIRFYEKQGLFSPERENNNYREYTEQDIDALKKIIILRKMGFTLEEIKLIQKDELSFLDAIYNTKQRLQDEIEQLDGSLKLVNKVSIACVVLLFLCVLRGLGKVLIWKESFWSGFLYPFIIFVV